VRRLALHERADSADDLARAPAVGGDALERARRALAVSGGSAVSQRMHAAAFVTIVPSGWLTSRAIETVSSPSGPKRASLARSASSAPL
jgi:hypothetical protein